MTIKEILAAIREAEAEWPEVDEQRIADRDEALESLRSLAEEARHKIRFRDWSVAATVVHEMAEIAGSCGDSGRLPQAEMALRARARKDAR